MGILFFGLKETGAERVAMATALRVSFCFFCGTHLWCQVSRTLLTLLEILFIEYFTIFSCKQYDVIADLICIIEKHQYL